MHATVKESNLPYKHHILTSLSFSEQNGNLHLHPLSRSLSEPSLRLFHWDQRTSAGIEDAHHQTVYACTLEEREAEFHDSTICSVLVCKNNVILGILP